MAVHRTVVIALDESPAAKHCFDWYLQHVHRPENKVILLTINAAAPPVFHRDKSEQMEAQYQDQLRRDSASKDFLNRFSSVCAEKGVTCEEVVKTGDPRDLILEVAEQSKACLIMIGSRGMGVLKRALMGSVSTHVVHHAHCPVTVVRQTDV
eukprot:CAMPEP_0114547770 /NCGR_PEP_ID=MMETSP0114-20121206/4633_1 /TAXON_ID=31324 /ORGANISM="Goniomonas sp, Strain m" /LENGTH=151 /DNA_ID=CAMNT_0001732331 /DNA_START=202 /DNA_END=657 /DNA_ORIENTATION=-